MHMANNARKANCKRLIGGFDAIRYTRTALYTNCIKDAYAAAEADYANRHYWQSVRIIVFDRRPPPPPPLVFEAPHRAPEAWSHNTMRIAS